MEKENLSDIKFEEDVRKCLRELSEDDAVKLIEYLRKQGVLCLKHLKYMSVEDIIKSSCVTKVQAGRLRDSCENKKKNLSDMDLGADVRKCLPDLSEDVVVKLVSYLKAQGVLCLKHLKHMDVLEIMKSDCVTKVQAGRLLDSYDEKKISKSGENKNDSSRPNQFSSNNEKLKEEATKSQLKRMYEDVKEIKERREAMNLSPSTAQSNFDAKFWEEYEEQPFSEMRQKDVENVKRTWNETDTKSYDEITLQYGSGAVGIIGCTGVILAAGVGSVPVAIACVALALVVGCVSYAIVPTATATMNSE